MENLIPIGKMAEINHITIATLRLYDENNLLKPHYIDPISKYRYYTLEQNARLDLIAYMKDLGMSLKEIQRVLTKENIDEIEAILSLKKEQIYQEIRKLKMRLHFVDDSIMKIERYRKSPQTGRVSLEYIQQRYIYGVDCPYDFYRNGLVDYEMDLALLRNHLFKLGLDQVYSYHIGTSITKEDFLKGNYRPNRIFLFSDHKIDNLPLEKVESSMFVTIYCSSFDEEKESILKMQEECKKNQYSINGDYLCEEITEFNVFDENKRNMFLRLQIPIRFTF